MAESKFPKNETVVAGSEVTSDLVCYSCDKAGEIKEAEGYCTDCREHMCTSCLSHHSRTTLTKHHTLVDKDNMPGTQGPSRFSDVCTQRCQIHKDEIIKYYCPTHKALACCDCMMSTHDACKGKLHIADEAKTLTDSEDLRDYQTTLANLKKKSETIIESSNGSIRHARACLRKTLYAIETFRKEINDALDKLKDTLEDQAERLVEQNKSTMTSLADKTCKVRTELQCIASDMDTLLRKKQHCQMFIEMKTSGSKLADIQQQLEKVGTSRITSFRFKPSEDLREIVRRNNALGELLVMDPGQMTFTHVGDIDIKSRENTNTCRIAGATILAKKKLVVADVGNATVKLIDTKRQQIISEHTPEQDPCDVAAINSKQVAVTIPDAKKITILKAVEQLTIDRQLRVNFRCHGIACLDDKLVVSCRSAPPSIRLLSMTGELLQNVSTSGRGEHLFSRFPLPTASAFDHVIYASAWKDNRVLVIDLDGTVITKYQADDLRSPCYTAVDELGMVYLGGAKSDNIHLLTPDCVKVKILLTEREGISKPYSMCYCRESRRLYVGMNNNDIVKVYQITCPESKF